MCILMVNTIATMMKASSTLKCHVFSHSVPKLGPSSILDMTVPLIYSHEESTLDPVVIAAKYISRFRHRNIGEFPCNVADEDA